MAKSQVPSETQTREQLLEEMLKTCQQIFAEAARQGLYVGAGYNNRLPTNKQEGPKVKKLHMLINQLTVGGQ